VELEKNVVETSVLMLQQTVAVMVVYVAQEQFVAKKIDILILL